MPASDEEFLVLHPAVDRLAAIVTAGFGQGEGEESLVNQLTESDPAPRELVGVAVGFIHSFLSRADDPEALWAQILLELQRHPRDENAFRLDVG